MSQEDKPGKVVDFSVKGEKADARKDARREAKAKKLQKRFSAARKSTESKSKATERLKQLFKHPPKKP